MPNKKTTHSWQIKIVNIIGAFGYLACLLQWLWVAMLYMNTIVGSGAWQFLTRPTPTTTVSSEPMINIPSGLAMIIAVVITFLVLIITIVIIWRLPRQVAVTGSKITKSTAKRTVPLIYKHKKLPEKQRKKLIERLTWSVKLLLVALPVILTLFSDSINLETSYDIAVTIGLFLAVSSIVWFGAQYISARSELFFC
jgi:hypothetical protein